MFQSSNLHGSVEKTAVEKHQPTSCYPFNSVLLRKTCDILVAAMMHFLDLLGCKMGGSEVPPFFHQSPLV
jgi:hypothetical protein